MDTKEEDVVDRVFAASTHDYILVFTSAGRVYWLKVYQIPRARRVARGKAIINLIQLQEKDEQLTAILPVSEFHEGLNLVFASRRGVVKRTDLMSYSNPRTNGIIAVKLDEDDALVGVVLTDGEQHIMLGTRHGKAIRFSESDARKMGRNTRGVKGITLVPGDDVVSMLVADASRVPIEEDESDEIEEPAAENEEEENGHEKRYGAPTILTVSNRGYGKRTPVEKYPLRHRGGQGVYTLKLSERNGEVVGLKQVDDDDEIMLITDDGKIIRLRVFDISITGRNTQGVRLINLEPDQHVTAVARIDEEHIDNGLDEEAEEETEEEPIPVSEENGEPETNNDET